MFPAWLKMVGKTRRRHVVRVSLFPYGLIASKSLTHNLSIHSNHLYPAVLIPSWPMRAPCLCLEVLEAISGEPVRFDLSILTTSWIFLLAYPLR